jgi:hypothetical protein
MLIFEVKVNASEIVMDADELREAIEKAVKQTIPCQLYALEVNVKE